MDEYDILKYADLIMTTRQRINHYLKRDAETYTRVYKILSDTRFSRSEKKRALYGSIDLNEDTKDLIWERYIGDRGFANGAQYDDVPSWE